MLATPLPPLHSLSTNTARLKPLADLLELAACRLPSCSFSAIPECTQFLVFELASVYLFFVFFLRFLEDIRGNPGHCVRTRNQQGLRSLWTGSPQTGIHCLVQLDPKENHWPAWQSSEDGLGRLGEFWAELEPQCFNFIFWDYGHNDDLLREWMNGWMDERMLNRYRGQIYSKESFASARQIRHCPLGLEVMNLSI